MATALSKLLSRLIVHRQPPSPATVPQAPSAATGDGAAEPSTPSAPTHVRNLDSYVRLIAAIEERDAAVLAELPSLGTVAARKSKLVSPIEAFGASYLVPENGAAGAYRMGKTQETGSFNKIRDCVDAQGQAGKMRVVHLFTQRNPETARNRIRPTALIDLRNELTAARAAGSPTLAGDVYHVFDPEAPQTLKVYMPMPDLGLDAFYLADFLHQDTAPAALGAALRSLTRQVVHRLVPLHEAGLVHCDIKLENVMVDRTGTVELIDFGLARGFPFAARGNRRGTLGYVAPEFYAEEDDVMVDARLDTWSLGNVLLGLVDPDKFGLLPNQHDVPQTLVEGSQTGERWLAAQPFASELIEGWTQDRLHRDGSLLRYLTAKPSKRKRIELAALDAVYGAFSIADPQFAKLVFQAVYRVSDRLDAKALRAAMATLPPLTHDQAHDEALGRRTLAAAFARTRGELASRTHAGPTLGALKALPTQL